MAFPVRVQEQFVVSFLPGNEPQSSFVLCSQGRGSPPGWVELFPALALARLPARRPGDWGGRAASRRRQRAWIERAKTGGPEGSRQARWPARAKVREGDRARAWGGADDPRTGAPFLPAVAGNRLRPPGPSVPERQCPERGGAACRATPNLGPVVLALATGLHQTRFLLPETRAGINSTIFFFLYTNWHPPPRHRPHPYIWDILGVEHTQVCRENGLWDGESPVSTRCSNVPG